MAIGTFLQARAYVKPLVLLPVTLAARFQEGALLCRADSDLRSPAGLTGRRVGVRAYSQTTGIWLRGILAEVHGVRAETVRWVTFEDAHVAEYRDPPLAERVAPAVRSAGEKGLRPRPPEAGEVGEASPPEMACSAERRRRAGRSATRRRPQPSPEGNRHGTHSGRDHSVSHAHDRLCL